MRILIDYRPALRQRTGVGEFIHNLIVSLADTDNVNTSSLDLMPNITAFSASWNDRLSESPSCPLPPSVRLIDKRIPVSLLNLAWHRFQWPPIEDLTQDIYEVVHSPHPLLIPSRSAAQVITIHDLDFFTNTSRTSAEIRRDYPRLVQEHASRADHIVVPSKYTASQVARQLHIPPQSITICPNGSPDWTPRKQTPTNGHLLFVGELTERKNISGLLNAYEILLTNSTAVPDLVLVGKQSTISPWQTRLRKSPLAERVRCTGYVDRVKLEEFYRNASALLIPSFDEGFGIPVIEAMTIGVPVVAVRRGALPEVVGDAGLLVDPDNDQMFAAAVVRILNDHQLVRTCRENGIQQAKAFNWNQSAKALLTAYRKAVVSRSSRMFSSK